jgi:hypothetical protein
MRGDTLPLTQFTNSCAVFFLGADQRFLLVKSRHDNGDRPDGGMLAVRYQISAIRYQEARDLPD